MPSTFTKVLVECQQATALDLPFYDNFAPTKVPFLKIFDNVISGELWFAPPIKNPGYAYGGYPPLSKPPYGRLKNQYLTCVGRSTGLLLVCSHLVIAVLVQLAISFARKIHLRTNKLCIVYISKTFEWELSIEIYLLFLAAGVFARFTRIHHPAFGFGSRPSMDPYELALLDTSDGNYK